MSAQQFFVVQRRPRWQRCLGAGVGAAVSLIVVGAGLTQAWTPSLAASLVCAAIVGGATAYVLMSAAITISFNADAELRVQLRPIYTRRWTPEQLGEVSVIDHVSTSLGSGLKRLPGGAFLILFDPGPAIEITPRTGRAVVVQTDRAAELVDTIRRARAGS